MKKIAIIGAGNMGNAIIHGLEGKYETIVSDSDKTKLKKFKVKTTTDNIAAVKESDIILLAVKPQTMETVLKEIAGTVGCRHLIISIAAGISTERIEKALGKIPVVRVMPNTPLMVGAGMSVICPGRYAESRHLKITAKIFAEMGKVARVEDENLMHAVTAVSGSGPAYLYLFIEELVKSAEKLGLKKKMAETFVLQTIKGSLALLEYTEKAPEVLRRQVTSPAGTTEAAIKVFGERKFDEIIEHAVFSACRRSEELGK